MTCRSRNLRHAYDRGVFEFGVFTPDGRIISRVNARLRCSSL
jgi:hypothetical protein